MVKLLTDISKRRLLTMKKLTYFFLLAIFVIAGCDTNPQSASARQCHWGIKQANKELKESEAKGFSGVVEATKAASLISAAAVQYEFGKYKNCNIKIKRARKFIKNAEFDKNKK